jgi:hypothetical protein
LNKDGEVVITGDFIYRIINLHCPWRAGHVYVLNKEQTGVFMKSKPQDFIKTMNPTKTVMMMAATNSYHAKEIIEQADGKVNPSSYFHYAYACKTELFHYLGGYDEDYLTYGWEDSDMFIRLFHIGVHLVPDYACAAIHPHHFRRADTAEAMEANMRDIFVSKSPASYFRNVNGWGQGARVGN